MIHGKINNFDTRLVPAYREADDYQLLRQCFIILFTSFSLARTCSPCVKAQATSLRQHSEVTSN
jgi:hypothetical protein